MEKDIGGSFTGASDLKSSSSYRKFKLQSNNVSDYKISKTEDRRSVLVVDSESYVLMLMEQFLT
jgi:hypothetical protein